MNKDEVHLNILNKLEINPKYTQRELSKELGVSLGKVNYCINKLIEKGLVKFINFKKNPNKAGYTYLLTPSGLEEKAKLTFDFLKIKMDEYEILKSEIKKLKEDADNFKIKK
jgi:EPS-associated MarR family transcriptional regulator